MTVHTAITQSTSWCEQASDDVTARKAEELNQRTASQSIPLHLKQCNIGDNKIIWFDSDSMHQYHHAS